MITLHPTSKNILTQQAAGKASAIIISGPHGADFSAAVNVMTAQLQAVQLRIDVADYGSAKEIRETYELTRTRPAQATIIVFSNAHTLSISAQNALLKLLEEPPAGYYFVLLTSQLDKILPTILSRSQHVRLLPITQKQSEQLLDSLSISDPTKRQQLLFIASGLPDELTRLATDEAYFQAKATLMRDARALLRDGAYASLQLIQRYKESREDALTLMEYCGRQIVQTLRQKPSRHASDRLKNILQATDALNKNANVRLTLLKVVV